MKNKGILFIVSGPSGVGKGTICKIYADKYKDECALSVSATTREMRDGEKDGESYFFITEDEFKKRIENGGFLEYAFFCGHYYGTPKEYVTELLDRGIDVILEIEVQGAMKVRAEYPEGVFIFVLPPDKKTLEERLRGRKTESEEELQKRLARAKDEFKFVEKYNYVIINDKADKAAEALHAIAEAEKCFMPRQLDFVKEEFLERNDTL